MINFIIADNNKLFMETIKDTIIKTISHEKIDYNIFEFTDYCDELEKIINNSQLDNKIYILEIELPTFSGIDIAQKIRKNDFDSLIVFFSAHDSYKYFNNIIQNSIMPLDYVEKFNPKRLEDTIQKAIKIKNQKKYITLNSNKNLFRINLNDILYITTSIENRGVVINTSDNEIFVNKTLNEIIHMLDNRFIKTHRSCYVNKDRIYKIEFKNRIITFDNHKSINLVSVREIKNLKTYFNE